MISKKRNHNGGKRGAYLPEKPYDMTNYNDYLGLIQGTLSEKHIPMDSFKKFVEKEHNTPLHFYLSVYIGDWRESNPTRINTDDERNMVKEELEALIGTYNKKNKISKH